MAQLIVTMFISLSLNQKINEDNEITQGPCLWWQWTLHHCCHRWQTCVGVSLAETQQWHFLLCVSCLCCHDDVSVYHRHQFTFSWLQQHHGCVPVSTNLKKSALHIDQNDVTAL